MLGVVVPSSLPSLGCARPADYNTQKRGVGRGGGEAEGSPPAPPSCARPRLRSPERPAARRSGAARAGAGPGRAQAGSGAGGGRGCAERGFLSGWRRRRPFCGASRLRRAGRAVGTRRGGEETERGRPGPLRLSFPEAPCAAEPPPRPPGPRHPLAASGAHAPLWKTTGSPGPCEC